MAGSSSNTYPTVFPRGLPEGWRIDSEGNLRVWERIAWEAKMKMTELVIRYALTVEYSPVTMEYIFVRSSTTEGDGLATQKMMT